MSARTIVTMPGDGIGKVVLPEALRVLEKVGFKREGLLRGRAYWHEKFCDLYMYAMLRGELTT